MITRENRHRWRQSVDEPALAILDDAAGWLRQAWQSDSEDPKSYPINTSHAFAEIEHGLKDRWRPPEPPKPSKLPEPRTREPQSLLDVVDEDVIAAVFEDQNEISYPAALKTARTDGWGKGFAMWHKIVRATEATYRIDYFGIECVPRPRTQFLHRNVLMLVQASGLADLTVPGLIEFFDDICPCRKKHNADAIRKLRARWLSRRG